jgi:hypothetical protein
MRHPIQLPNYMGCLMEFYSSLALFYTKMSFKILKTDYQSFAQAIYFSQYFNQYLGAVGTTFGFLIRFYQYRFSGIWDSNTDTGKNL